MDKQLRDKITNIVTRNGKSGRIPEILEVEVDSLCQLVVESQPKTTFLKTWLSIDMGAKIHFEPKGMWGHRIWQTPNAGDYICSGIKKIDGSESITDHYDYRFTKVGEGSVGDDYDDITLRGKDIKRWYDNGATGDIETPHGFFMFSGQSQLIGSKPSKKHEQPRTKDGLMI